MKLFFRFVLAVFLLASCKDSESSNDIQVQVNNHCNIAIDSLKLHTIFARNHSCDSTLLTNIAVSNERLITWKGVYLCDADGSFWIRTYGQGKLIERVCGYYSNGVFLDKKITIDVYSDSLVVDFVTKY